MKLKSCALYWQNKIFKLKAESGDAEGEESKGNTSENEEEDNKTASSDTILRDFNYKLRCMFMESNRNLKASWLETISCSYILLLLWLGHLMRLIHMTTVFSSTLIVLSWLSFAFGQVKSLMVAFEESSVYGARTGFQELVVITANTQNVFHTSLAWRRGVISGVSMLQRQDMIKPPRVDGKWGSDARFTKVQEMKQDCLYVKLSGHCVTSY